MTPEELRAWLRARGMTQAELGLRLGLYVCLEYGRSECPTVSRWLNGRGRVPRWLPASLEHIDRLDVA